ncbi:IPT/TIG domain-containing protein [Nocardia gipuzkoensis]|uniref:IPT/TIG domain-containing protein n=1 Tax=Nocardia gipuzkoensis TaxID=2749991 RepID=UPI0015EF9B44|nr:IPT/TIG domain-containing protein [Nocardia gipuzkoensis]
MAPTITSLSPTAGPPAGGNNVTITGTGFDFVTTVRFGTVATTFTVDSTTRITAIAPPGGGTVPVTVITSPGGTSNGVPYTYAGVPSVSGVSPSQGPTTGGTTVTLTGTNLTGATAVTFGATPAVSFTVNSATQVTAVAPPGSGTVQVTVTTPAGTSNGVSYAYIPVTAPTLTSVVPSSGPAAGGTTVTLTGTGLSSATSVRFGATAASFTVVSATQITALAPPGAGTVQVTVITPGGTSNGVPYTYAATPSLIGVSPSQGPTSGGTTVTLTGTNLTNATAVTFGATPATSFTVVSATQITAVVPPGFAGAVNVTVTTPGGASTLPSSYFYRAIPALTGVSPSSGPLVGGNTVALTGTHFLGATTVRFGATAASAFTVVSDTQITATAPPNAAGTIAVTIITPAGTSNGVSYTYLPTPTITSLNPNNGPTTGGNSVTVTGTNLAQTTTVLFGATPAAFTVVSNTQIVTDPPPGAAGPVNLTIATPGGTSTPAVYTRVAPPAI